MDEMILWDRLSDEALLNFEAEETCNISGYTNVTYGGYTCPQCGLWVAGGSWHGCTPQYTLTSTSSEEQLATAMDKLANAIIKLVTKLVEVIEERMPSE